MYLMRKTIGRNDACEFSSSMLIECGAYAGRRILDTIYERHEYYPMSAQQAHRWVKDGGPHETSLYVDYNGRIRRASGGF